MNSKIVRTAVFTFVFSALLGLAACNTIEGAGRDVQSAGEKIENAADKANK